MERCKIQSFHSLGCYTRERKHSSRLIAILVSRASVFIEVTDLNLFYIESLSWIKTLPVQFSAQTWVHFLASLPQLEMKFYSNNFLSDQNFYIHTN